MGIIKGKLYVERQGWQKQSCSRRNSVASRVDSEATQTHCRGRRRMCVPGVMLNVLA